MDEFEMITGRGGRREATDVRASAASRKPIEARFTRCTAVTVEWNQPGGRSTSVQRARRDAHALATPSKIFPVLRA